MRSTRCHSTVRRRCAAVFAVLCVFSFLAHAEQQCDTQKPESTPTHRFKIDVVNAVAIDSVTGLAWKICAEGSVYTQGRCIGNATFSWNAGIKMGAGSGWRMPTARELATIVETRCIAPSVNSTVFPDTQSGRFWSSTQDPDDDGYAHNYYFGRGLLGNDLKMKSYYVRLVRKP